MRHAPHDDGHDAIMYSALFDAVRGLRWRARRASRVAVPGIHASRVRGTSAEFTEYRPYRQGDDPRRIDWKLFARSDRAHVRISEERAVTPTCLVLDASASMAFPDGPDSKWSVARLLTAALASVAHSGGDPVGLLVSGNARATIAPRTRRGIVGNVIQTLASVKVGESGAMAPSVILAGRLATRIAIVSDFLGDLDDTLQVARELGAAGRDVHALHVIASEECEPPVTITVVTDPEIEHCERSLTGETRAGYVRAFSEWRTSVASRWLASGAAYQSLIIGNEPLSHSVRRIVRDEPVALHSA